VLQAEHELLLFNSLRPTKVIHKQVDAISLKMRAGEVRPIKFS